MRRLAIHYAIRLAFAHLLACVAATAIVIPLGGFSRIGARGFFTETNVAAAVVLTLLGTVAVAIAGVRNITPTLRWFVPGRAPSPDQRRAAMRLVGRQSAILAATWAISGTVITLINLKAGAAVAVPTFLGVVLGAAAAVGIGLLLTQDALRPILAATSQGTEGWVTVPSVLARLVGMWILCTALPSGIIAALILIRANGWIVAKSAPIELPILVAAAAAVLLGLPVMMLTSRSISVPLREVVTAMARVKQGQLDTSVGVYERSEIGQLQTGFNQMVAGLAERERLRDLFGRHVGTNVARRAVEEGASMSGGVQEAAILYIDLVGSTPLAASSPPQQVAEVLNGFFRIVVDAVDEHDGLINKFEGDAALAVFGAPLRTSGAASAALATARSLAVQLGQLPRVDFGIGVSAGQVFAGNIGAENRYEYTVIGDPVNEAARLADLAKTSEERILSSAAAIERADPGERRHWATRGTKVLRGRSEATQICVPIDND
ncbi:MAG: adenylate/guanylate cyclase domain-containing protein [Mycobacteriaceae bacterium]|nr:adenylate/guanylate cyclase domain-containing protein [Mycobacteriaceae bacterium]